MRAIRGDGGMRALPPGSSGGGGGGGEGIGGGYGGSDPQPMVWVLVVFFAAAPFAVCFGIDVLSAAWCHFDGCVSSHYLADLIHAIIVAAAVSAGLVALWIGHRRGWIAAIVSRELTGAARLTWALRRARARRAARRRVEQTTVRATVRDEDEDVVDAEIVDPAPLTATRPESVDVEVLLGGSGRWVPSGR